MQIKNELLFQQPVDFVVDAIDTMSSKLELIRYCVEHKIPFISSMGMANRMDPTKIEITDLMKTNYDPVAKIMRNLVRKNKNQRENTCFIFYRTANDTGGHCQ